MAAARATETKPNRAERIAIATALRAVAPLADADLVPALAEARVRSIARGADLLRGGERATHAFIVLDGVLDDLGLNPSPSTPGSVAPAAPPDRD